MPHLHLHLHPTPPHPQLFDAVCQSFFHLLPPAHQLAFSALDSRPAERRRRAAILARRQHPDLWRTACCCTGNNASMLLLVEAWRRLERAAKRADIVIDGLVQAAEEIAAKAGEAGCCNAAAAASEHSGAAARCDDVAVGCGYAAAAVAPRGSSSSGTGVPGGGYEARVENEGPGCSRVCGSGGGGSGGSCYTASGASLQAHGGGQQKGAGPTGGALTGPSSFTMVSIHVSKAYHMWQLVALWNLHQLASEHPRNPSGIRQLTACLRPAATLHIPHPAASTCTAPCSTHKNYPLSPGVGASAPRLLQPASAQAAAGGVCPVV